MKLWKTTVEILTDYDPKDSSGLDELNQSILDRKALHLKTQTREEILRDYGPDTIRFFKGRTNSP